jgi:hypothetical protein
MIRKVTGLFLACMFLTSSLLLPLGDFSLIQDIPGMYRNYAKITTAEELGVIDFIGDYMLHGKEFFGHNSHDKTQDAASNIQFRHQANPLTVVLSPVCLCTLTVSEIQKTHSFRNKPMMRPGYYQELLRPPLVQAYLS